LAEFADEEAVGSETFGVKVRLSKGRGVLTVHILVEGI